MPNPEVEKEPTGGTGLGYINHDLPVGVLEASSGTEYRDFE